MRLFLLLLFMAPLALAKPLPTIHLRSSLPQQLQSMRPETASERPAGFLHWRNPKLSDPGRLSRDGIPEGMTLIGPDGEPSEQLDPTKNVIIYVHGWAPESLPHFPYAAEWHQAGFNPFVFRWHKRAHAAFLTAHELAESGRLGNELSQQIYKIRRLLDQGEPGRYTGEIRLVGYSLGAVPALQAAYRVFYQDPTYGPLDWLRHYARRVDLLEPAFITHFMLADQVVVDERTRILTPPQISASSVGLPARLDGWGVKVVAFTSVVDRYITPNLERSMLTQHLRDDWKPGPNQPNIVDQHVAILDYYFHSISLPEPRIRGTLKRALSARTPTDMLGQRQLARLVQVKGQNTLPVNDDIYEQEDVPTNRGGVLVDFDPYHTDNDTLKNTVITLPMWQKPY